jgi:hypothetical protein
MSESLADQIAAIVANEIAGAPSPEFYSASPIKRPRRLKSQVNAIKDAIKESLRPITRRQCAKYITR